MSYYNIKYMTYQGVQYQLRGHPKQWYDPYGELQTPIMQHDLDAEYLRQFIST